MILNVLMTKMVTDLFAGRERLLAMSMLINAWPIGIGISLVVIGPLASCGWRWGVASSALFALIGLLSSRRFYRPPMQSAGSAARARRHRHRRTDAKGVAPAGDRLAAMAAVQRGLPDRAIVPALVPGRQRPRHRRAGCFVAVNTVLFVVSVQAGGFLLERTARPDRLCDPALVAWSATLLLITAGHCPLPWLVLGGLVGGIPAAALVSLPGEFLRA